MIPSKNLKNIPQVIQLSQLELVKAPILKCCVGMLLLGGYATTLYLSVINGQLFIQELLLAGAVIGLLIAKWKLSAATTI
ncbi:MAG: hypothetical protein ABNH00_10780 [Dokdonia sp.]|jgi:hypothetical protein